VAVTVPSTQDLNSEIIDDLAGSFAQTIPFLPKSFLRVIAKVLAGKLAISFRYNAFTLLQLFVAHASFEETTVRGKRIRPLVEWGRLLGEGDPLPAQRAELAVVVTVTNQTGFLRAGAQLLYQDTGVIYSTAFDVPLDASEVSVTIRATNDPDGNGGAGTIGNLPADSVLTFANPLANVGNARVVSVAVAGADAETGDVYRARVMRRAKARPQGGAYADYREWGESVSGIVRVYPYTGELPGTVEIYCEATEASSGSADGIPTGPQLTAVLDAINLNNISGKATRRPANAAPLVLPISRTDFDLTVVGLSPISQDLKDAIVAAADEYLRGREPYIVGVTSLPRADRITVGALSGVIEEVASAAGAAFSSIVLESTLGLGDSWTLDRGEKAKLATPVTYA
jgi:baseplate J-like protein